MTTSFASYRERLAQAKRTLHDRMSLQGLVFRYQTPPVAPENISVVRVRKFDKFERIGDLAGTTQNFAEFADNMPRILFETAEWEAERSDIVIIDATTGFRVDVPWPSDDGFMLTHVVRLTPSEMEGYPVLLADGTIGTITAP